MNRILRITDDKELMQVFDACCTMEHDYSLEVYIDGIYEFKPLLKDKETFEKCMIESENFVNQAWQDDEFHSESIKCINYFKEHFDNVIDSVDYILLSFDELNTKEFIKENPIIHDKKIALYERLTITDEERINELLLEYSEFKENMYISLEGNADFVSLIDCKKTIDKIKEKAEYIKKLNLSPMESIMYLYDQVRNRVYKDTDTKETALRSRDLTQVMFGEEIVCLGYSNIMHAVLNYLGIRSKVVFLQSPEQDVPGHARNAAYVKDPKYNIDGVYYFDATWDGKEEDNNYFLMMYTFFAKTKGYMYEEDIGHYYETDIPRYNHYIYDIVEKALKEDNTNELYNFLKTINNMSKLAIGERLIDLDKNLLLKFTEEEKEELLEKFASVCEKYDREIDAETMIRLFNNVRKLEHYQNEEFYPYSLGTLLKTTLVSEWEFSGSYLTKMEKFERIMSGETTTRKKHFYEYMKRSDIAKQEKQVELTKVLRKYRDKKLGK